MNNPLDEMRQACSDRCRARFAINAAALGICLRACSKRTREDCVGTCSSEAAGADQAACGVACQLLCPAAVTPAPLLTDLTCCVIPPLVCDSKGTLDNQVRKACVQYCCDGQCCGSGIRCLKDSGIRNRFFRIPDRNPYFCELGDNFWVKSSIIL